MKKNFVNNYLCSRIKNTYIHLRGQSLIQMSVNGIYMVMKFLISLYEGNQGDALSEILQKDRALVQGSPSAKDYEQVEQPITRKRCK